MIQSQPMTVLVNINGRTESVLDVNRVDSHIALLTTASNSLQNQQFAADQLQAALATKTQEFKEFMEFYFSMMPDMRRAFNDWKIAQKTKERILDERTTS